MKEHFLNKLKTNFKPSVIIVEDKHGSSFYPAKDFDEACKSCLRIVNDLSPCEFEVYDREPVLPESLDFDSAESVPKELRDEAKRLISNYLYNVKAYQRELYKRRVYGEIKESQDGVAAYEFILYNDHITRINLEELR